MQLWTGYDLSGSNQNFETSSLLNIVRIIKNFKPFKWMSKNRNSALGSEVPIFLLWYQLALRQDVTQLVFLFRKAANCSSRYLWRSSYEMRAQYRYSQLTSAFFWAPVQSLYQSLHGYVQYPSWMKKPRKVLEDIQYCYTFPKLYSGH